jgi:hypothetical protein
MASPRGLARRLGDLWQVTGVRSPLVAACWLVQREYLVTAREIEPGGPAPRLLDARWEREDARAEVLVGRDAFPGSREGIRRRLGEGQECWVAWLDGEPAHRRWETSRPAWLPYLGLWLHPQAGDLCVVDVYTRPRFRHRGLRTAGTRLALERAPARGLTRLIGLVA